jgi:hydroxymethylglutaryl-CoA lyase
MSERLNAHPRPGSLHGPDTYPTVELVEEGMREGLQIESADIQTVDKIALLNALAKTGLRNIVVGSFVSPKWTPQMALVDEIVKAIEPQPGVTYSALALNERGRERRAQFTPPLSSGIDLPATNAHLCDVFAQRNTNRTQAVEIASWPATIERAVASGATEAQVGVGAAWGSNWVGSFEHAERMTMIERQVDLWLAAGTTVTTIFLTDPMGWNQPQLVEEDLHAISNRWPSITQVHLHLHNTRGVAMASFYAALRALDNSKNLVFDTSIGGMAGCPYCGNGRAAQLVATEDAINLLDGIGFDTGVDLLELIRVVELAESIVGHRLYGHTSKAGPRPEGDALYPMDMPFIETLAQARHFLDGASTYKGALSPWAAPITSPQRQE